MIWLPLHFCFVRFCDIGMVFRLGSLGACSCRFERILVIKCLKWAFHIFHCFVEDCLRPLKRLSERLKLLFRLRSEFRTQALLWSLAWCLFILWKYIMNIRTLIIFEEIYGRRLCQILIYDLPVSLDGGSLVHNLFFQIINLSFKVWAHWLNNNYRLLI